MFKNGNFNYNKFQERYKIKFNFKRYNKTIKMLLGEKGTCNLIIFLNFINKEINRINRQKMRILMSYLIVWLRYLEMICK